VEISKYLIRLLLSSSYTAAALSLYGPSTEGQKIISTFKTIMFKKGSSHLMILRIIFPKLHLGSSGGVQKGSCNSCSSKLALSSKVGHVPYCVSCIMNWEIPDKSSKVSIRFVQDQKLGSGGDLFVNAATYLRIS